MSGSGTQACKWVSRVQRKGKEEEGSPPGVVLRTQLDIRADHGHLHGDQHCEGAHHKAEPENVVEVPLQAMHVFCMKDRCNRHMHMSINVHATGLRLGQPFVPPWTCASTSFLGGEVFNSDPSCNADARDMLCT